MAQIADTGAKPVSLCCSTLEDFIEYLKLITKKHRATPKLHRIATDHEFGKRGAANNVTAADIS